LDPGYEDDKQFMILNRYVRYYPDRLEIEADPRHAEIIISSLGLTQGRGVETLGEKWSHERATAEYRQLPREEQKLYRSVTMRAAYLSQDRSDISKLAAHAAHLTNPM
jgi:hypothetical protein